MLDSRGEKSRPNSAGGMWVAESPERIARAAGVPSRLTSRIDPGELGGSFRRKA